MTRTDIDRYTRRRPLRDRYETVTTVTTVTRPLPLAGHGLDVAHTVFTDLRIYGFTPLPPPLAGQN